MDMDLEADTFRTGAHSMETSNLLDREESFSAHSAEVPGVLCGQILFTAKVAEKGRGARGELHSIRIDGLGLR
jgi:hypothetical protein